MSRIDRICFYLFSNIFNIYAHATAWEQIKFSQVFNYKSHNSFLGPQYSISSALKTQSGTRDHSVQTPSPMRDAISHWAGCMHRMIIMRMRPANERWRYMVTPSLIGWVHTENDPWDPMIIQSNVTWNCIKHKNDKGMKHLKIWIHRIHPISCPHPHAMGCLLCACLEKLTATMELNFIDLTYLPLDKMAAISQIFADAFLRMKSFVYWLKFH